MANFIKNESTSKSNFIHIYSGVSIEEMEKRVDKLLLSLGYKIKEGDPGNGIYEKGNRALRIIFGAFAKYYKFHIASTLKSDELMVEVKRATSGMSGGVVGMRQVQKELKNLEQQLQTI